MAETDSTTPAVTMPLSGDELRQAGLAEAIVSSEAFMWLMQGVGDWTQTHIDALQKAYKMWQQQSGGYIRYNGLAQRMLQSTAPQSPEVSSSEPS